MRKSGLARRNDLREATGQGQSPTPPSCYPLILSRFPVAVLTPPNIRVPELGRGLEQSMWKCTGGEEEGQDTPHGYPHTQKDRDQPSLTRRLAQDQL